MVDNDKNMKYPTIVFHWINDKKVESSSNNSFEKLNPADGKVLTHVTRGNRGDVDQAVKCAGRKFDEWKSTSVIYRADILRKAAQLMETKKEEIAHIVHLETGKSIKDALAEVEGSIDLGYFYAGEGRRFYGKVTTSAVPNRTAMIIREPVGIAALIVPANTPIANIAWKVYPALLCGNTIVLKASKDTPYTAIWFAKILKEAGLPSGVLNVVQGFGDEVGTALIVDTRISLISFTGSVEVGRQFQEKAGPRFAKISLELGGKNPFVVCDDADLESAANFAVLSAFSNAGQRCASGSRIIIFASIYEKFKKLMFEKTKNLKLGISDTDDLGPVINKSQLDKIIGAINKAQKEGARILIGGTRLMGSMHENGYYITPTILENVVPDADISCQELFGPVTILYKVRDFNEALKLANNSLFGLTSAIHTSNINRIQEFTNRVQSGVVSINGPTYGSEPHLPFGGVKNSGNGTREPGTEALDFYSNIKTIYTLHNPERV